MSATVCPFQNDKGKSIFTKAISCDIIITKRAAIKIACNNETDLTEIRSVIYAGEKHGIYTENSELLKIYFGKDYRYNDYIAEFQNHSQDSNGEQDGTGSIGETQQQRRDTALKVNN